MSSHELKTCWTRSPTRARSCCGGRARWSADYDAWSDARDEAASGLPPLAAAPAAETYAVYRAAQDREDAAQDTLAQTQMSRTSVS